MGKAQPLLSGHRAKEIIQAFIKGVYEEEVVVGQPSFALDMCNVKNANLKLAEFYLSSILKIDLIIK